MMATPISFREIQRMMVAHGLGKQQFQSPLRIDEELYLAAYSRGMGLSTNAA
jgi:hypothetical protein